MIYLRVIYFVRLVAWNGVMHVAAIVVTGLLDIIEGLFAIGLAGSTAVLILSFVDDVKTIFS
ncbi:MAG TPA: hypothetical protein VFU86_19620 [Terriglobales bacterium]|nr:hypothetical protein [Terriglobales bacterium]